MNDIEIVAHRGGLGPYMENTLEAFDRVIKLGITGIALDVRMDYRHRRFFLEHDFFHHPKYRQNLLSNVIPQLPKNILHLMELKTVAWRKEYVQRFIKVYRELLQDRNVVVISFNPFVLMRLKQLCPEIPRGFLIRGYFWRYVFKYFLHSYMDPRYLLFHRRHLKMLSWAQNKKMKVFVYPMNTVKWWEIAIISGVDGVITDYPLLFKDFMNKNRHKKYFL